MHKVVNKLYYGAHYSISGGIINALKMAVDNHANTVQVFLSNPRGSSTKKRSDQDIAEFVNYLSDNSLTFVVHAPYTLNFAKSFTKKSWWLRTLITELTLGAKLHSLGSVVHCGKTLDLSREASIDNMYKSLSYVLEQTSSDCKIILETAAGQGTELGASIEEFAEIYNMFSANQKKRLTVCIDTCHIFVAGYDITREQDAKAYLAKFDQLIGLKHVSLIQFNDSKYPLNARVDRHANIGHGYIGRKNTSGLAYFVKFAYKHGIPVVLETPGNDKINKKELKFISSVISKE
ncbi:MAG: apurinic endonuclease [Faunusvirus sp.]|jgi:deoxyribonuclease-4|uniref:Apurinic endonuclease n=1 Tax=Faunusvirus sp. TaxID=2487766 RepID=A0A3G4ZXZ7_9VIRU|nr:MAG: apurinic endonuclease [Faunusvirus sp.]